MLSAQSDLEGSNLEHVEVVVLAAIVGRIALQASAMRRGGYGPEHVDHGAASGCS
jgi:hypothetical protein